MFFDSEFIDKVKENPIEGIIEIYKQINETLVKLHLNDSNEDSDEDWDERQEIVMEAASLIKVIIEKNNFEFKTQFPVPAISSKLNCSHFYDYISQANEYFKGMNNLLILQKHRKFHEKILNDDGVCYEFDEADLKRVQELINELRGLISANEVLGNDHKHRLLKRLEALQSELHKTVSDLDRLWGMVGDVGRVINKLGKDAEPVFDRIKELTGIVWKTQARAEGLPNSQNPMLGQYEDE